MQQYLILQHETADPSDGFDGEDRQSRREGWHHLSREIRERRRMARSPCHAGVCSINRLGTREYLSPTQIIFWLC
jgi:hypothetical protein